MNPPAPTNRSAPAAAAPARGGRRFNPYQHKRSAGSASSAPRIKTTTFALPHSSPTSPQPPPPLSSAQLRSLIWLQYFPHEPHTVGSALDTKLRAMQSFVDRHRSAASGVLFDVPAIRETHVCTLAVRSFLDDAPLALGWPQFATDLNETPEPTLNCVEFVLHTLIAGTAAAADEPPALTINRCLRRVRLRLLGCQPCVSLRSLKVCNYGRLVTVSGTIIRANTAHLLCTWLAFACPACAAQQIVRQPDGCMTAPTRCATDGCRCQSGFAALLGSVHTRTAAGQRIRLQESMQGAQFESGRVPRTVELEFAADLVDACSPGDEVTVTGVLKVQSDDGGGGDGGGGGGGGGGGAGQRKEAMASMHRLYVDVVAVTCDKNVMKMRRSEFSAHDLEAIGRIRAEPCVLRLLVHSLCPGIYGHEMVKAGLILGLFGATGNSTSSSTTSSSLTPLPSAITATTTTTVHRPASTAQKRRSEAHVLVVGDPGVGKSQMLQACAAVSPRGIFVCGNSSSRAGLTVSVRHEKGAGGNTLEAGALVLADQGCCCIDEFDKMAANHEALLEVMEDQLVSVAKAGVLCSLPARTCVLAAANPAGGHYDPGRTLVANLRMNPALLSRFDLVFVLLDRPDEHTDRLMTAHITAMYAGGAGAGATAAAERRSAAHPPDASQTNASLLGRLRLGERTVDALPHVLMQKYIGYARKQCHPQLTAAAAAELRSFYLALRSEPRSPDATPVTTRQLEALVRLTQARARVDLCALATREHALDVLDIVRHSQAAVRRCAGAEGAWARERGAQLSGKRASQATQCRRLLAALRSHSERLGRTVLAMDEMRDVAATVEGVCATDCGRLVDALNMQGVLLKKGQHMYKLLAE